MCMLCGPPAADMPRKCRSRVASSHSQAFPLVKTIWTPAGTPRNSSSPSAGSPENIALGDLGLASIPSAVIQLRAGLLLGSAHDP
jgi:hypothetical protein